VVLTDQNAWVSRNRNRFQSSCKTCSGKYARQWIKRNLESELARRRRYYAENREHLKEAFERGRLKRKYGLTREEVAEMRNSQGGVCAICLKNEAAAIDHDHETGAVRALLCNSCNSILGFAGESPRILRQAALYLERWSGVIDETPGAYKDIDAVIEAERDLVDVMHTLHQVVCVKG
jgi:hypothetical protein